MSAWAWLAAGVLTQWLCISALRASHGLRRRGWAALTFVMLAVSMWCVSVSLARGLSVAVAYGIWTGACIALAALTGHLVFGDRLNRPQTAGLLLILLGVVLLQTG